MEWLYRLYGLLLRRCKGDHKSLPQGNIGPLSVSLEYHKPAHHIKADALMREATAHKEEGRWDKAISNLRKAYAILGEDIHINYPLETALRLPLYLQQAGRYEEAQQEFQRLLSSVDERAATAFSHQPKAVQREFAQQNREKILDKMRLAEKREQKRRAKKSGA